MRKLALCALSLALAIPGPAAARIDTACSSTTMTSSIGGVVKDANNVAVSGLTVELYTTNSSAPLPDKAITDTAGRYRICVGSAGGAGHGTYDVHVRDQRPAPRFAGVNQPYSTHLQSTDLDFTPASRFPVLYATYLTISPAHISTATSAVNVTWTARSKAPIAGTTMKLTLGHIGSTVEMGLPVAENGGPAEGGWNRWTHTARFERDTTDALWWADVQGFEGTIKTTERDRIPYVIDNQGPLFGHADSSAAKCGPGVVANAFTPGAPGTTNPQPTVRLGVCDKYSNGAKSGLNPYTLTGTMCRDVVLSLGCQSIDPVLDTTTIAWWPRAPLALGDYYFGFSIADLAGNTTVSPQSYKLSITNSGGQVPVITAVQPGNLGSGSTAGIVVGSSLTTPNSLPHVGFRVTDADGQLDLAPGSLRVRVYYSESKLEYEYDPAKAPNDYDPLTGRGGAFFNLSEGVFRATGYSLAGKQPGRYVATASVTDHGGNTATMTWQWILVGAA